MLVWWQVSETGHFWRSVGAQAFALVVADERSIGLGWVGDEVGAEAPRRIG